MTDFLQICRELFKKTVDASPLFWYIYLRCGEVAQLARARGSYPRCREFESPPRYEMKSPEAIGFRGFFNAHIFFPKY